MASGSILTPGSQRGGNSLLRRGGPGRHYAAFFATVGFAGLRPSEAARLRVHDLVLPPHGWGEAHLSGALTSPGPLYTADGDALEEKGLKQRSDGESRTVPLPPALV